VGAARPWRSGKLDQIGGKPGAGPWLGAESIQTEPGRERPQSVFAQFHPVASKQGSGLLFFGDPALESCRQPTISACFVRLHSVCVSARPFFQAGPARAGSALERILPASYPSLARGANLKGRTRPDRGGPIG